MWCASERTFQQEASARWLLLNFKSATWLLSVQVQNGGRIKHPSARWFRFDQGAQWIIRLSDSENIKVQFTVHVKFTLKQATKAYRGSRRLLYYFFNLGSRWGGRWWRPRPGRFTLRKNPIPLYRRLGGPPGASLEGCGKSRSHQDSILGPSCP